MPLSKIKRAGFYELNHQANAGRGEYPRIEAGSLTAIGNSYSKGDSP